MGNCRAPFNSPKPRKLVRSHSLPVPSLELRSRVGNTRKHYTLKFFCCGCLNLNITLVEHTIPETRPQPIYGRGGVKLIIKGYQSSDFVKILNTHTTKMAFWTWSVRSKRAFSPYYKISKPAKKSIYPAKAEYI